MKNKILNYINENNMISKGDKVVIGVSGGADSICLLVLLNELKKELAVTLEAVHIHHGIRGEEADSDMEYVKMICEKLGINCHVFMFDVISIAKKSKKSVEEEGRRIRYECFEKICKKTGADKIAVAHNQNDSVETMLFSMVRGTGIKGLCGIQAKRDNIIRPLLSTQRSQIEEYLNDKNIEYKTDSTNLDDVYTRNKFRLNIIPEMTKINTRAVNNIARTGNMLEEIEEYLKEQTEAALKKTCSAKDEKISISINNFKKENIVIQKRIILEAIFLVGKAKKNITEKHILSVLELFSTESGKQTDLPYDLIAYREYDFIVIKIKKEKQSFLNVEINISEIFAEKKVVDIEVGSKVFKLFAEEKHKGEIAEKLYTKFLNYDKIRDSFQFRNRRNGDYINLKNGKKKIKDYFIDQKIPREKRDNIILLAKGSQIIWIVGYRINEEYKVTENTKKILRIELVGGEDVR